MPIFSMTVLHAIIGGGILFLLGTAVSFFLRRRPRPSVREPLPESQMSTIVFDAGARLHNAHTKDDVYTIACRAFTDLIGDVFIAVGESDAAGTAVRLVKLIGFEKYLGQMQRILGKKAFDTPYPMADIMKSEAVTTSGDFHVLADGLFDLTGHTVPRTVCRLVETILGIDRVYSVSFSYYGTIVGGAAILAKSGSPEADRKSIESIARQAALVLQRIRVEERLTQSEEKLRAILNTIPYPIFAKNAEMRYSECNKAFEDYLGKRREDIIGRSVYEISPPDKAAVYDAADRALWQSRGSQQYDGSVRYHDGSDHTVSFYKGIYRNGNGDPDGIVGVMYDITERIAMENALRESEKRFRETTDLLPIAVYEADMTGRITFANRKAYELFGYTPADVASGVTVIDMVVPEDRERARAGVAGLSGDDEHRSEYTALRKDGKRVPVAIFYSVIMKNGAVSGFRGAAMDITEERAAAERMQREAKRMEALARIAAMHNEKEMFDEALAAMLVLTKSDIGYIYFYDEDKKVFEIYSWSKSVMERCTIAEPQTKYMLDHTGLWGDVVRYRKTVVANEYAADPRKKGYPEGHVPLSRFLSVPVFDTDRIVAVAGVANKHLAYDGFDEHELSLFMQGVWNIVTRKRAEHARMDSDDKFRELTDLLPVSVFETDAKGAITFINMQGITSKGYSPDDFSNGFNAAEFVIPADRERLVGNMIAIARGQMEPPTVGEFTALHKDGSVFPAIIYASPRFADGAFAGFRGIAVDISERKRFEEEMRVSEDKYRTLVANLPDIVLVHDNGTIRYVNDAIPDVTGYSIDDLIGKHISDFIHPDDVPIAVTYMRRRIAGETVPPVYDLRLKTKSGGMRDFEVRAALVTYEGKQAHLSVLTDITERKAAEAALKESEAKYRAVMESSLVGLYIIQDMQFRYVNNAYADLFGYRPEEMIDRMSPIDLIVPEIRDSVKENLTRRASGEPGKPYEVRCVRRDGSRFDAQVWGKGIMYQGRPASVGSLIDITERSKAEAVIRESELRFRTIVEHINDGFIVHDFSGRILDCNDIACRSLGYARDELIGLPISAIDSSDDAGKIGERMRMLKEHGAVEFDAEHVRRDGTSYPVMVSASIVSMDGEGRIQSFVRDITERKSAERKLRAYMAEIERSNRELADFAYVASHDLQEPLRKVRTFSDRLMSRCASDIPGEARGYLEVIDNATKRMQALIGDLLSYSRVGAGVVFSQVALDDVVADALATLSVAIEESHASIARGSLPVITADRTQMKQLFENIIGNAVKFRRPGVIPQIRISGERDAEMVRITIEDNGIGFDEKYREKIFTIFQRLHNADAYPGTGVGLAICRKIVSRHNGTITAAATDGAGARFTITLPAGVPNADRPKDV